MSKEKDLSPMNFDDAVIAIDVSILGEKYVLKEAMGTAASNYRNKSVAGIRLSSRGKAETLPNNPGNLNTELLAACIFKVAEDPNNPAKKVPLAVVYSWPDKTIEALAKRLKEISDLDSEEETVEALEKQIKEIQERIVELKEEETAKNGD